uniref:Transmembrane protein 260 n=1 Tax=Haemonchus placei TaxID=6290 RepID=A0A0N4WQM6_HAEPC
LQVLIDSRDGHILWITLGVWLTLFIRIENRFTMRATDKCSPCIVFELWLAIFAFLNLILGDELWRFVSSFDEYSLHRFVDLLSWTDFFSLHFFNIYQHSHTSGTHYGNFIGSDCSIDGFVFIAFRISCMTQFHHFLSVAVVILYHLPFFSFLLLLLFLRFPPRSAFLSMFLATLLLPIHKANTSTWRRIHHYHYKILVSDFQVMHSSRSFYSIQVFRQLTFSLQSSQFLFCQRGARRGFDSFLRWHKTHIEVLVTVSL